MTTATGTGIKADARMLVESLADDATWDDFVALVKLRALLEERLAESDRGDLVSHEEIKRRFGLPA